MNMEIQIFKDERFGEVRTMVINGEPWFVGKDVGQRRSGIKVLQLQSVKTWIARTKPHS